MQREGVVVGGKRDGETITCEEFGYTPTTLKIWWLPDTKEKFSYEDGRYYPYEGPIVHGTGYSF